MKHIIIFFCFSCLMFCAVYAQKTTPCATYDCMMQQGEAAYNKADYVTAFKKFKGAKAYNFNNTPALNTEADTWIEKTFDGIEKQRQAAIENKKKAEANEKKAKKAQTETGEALQIAEKNKRLADEAATLARQKEAETTQLLVAVQKEKAKADSALVEIKKAQAATEIALTTAKTSAQKADSAKQQALSLLEQVKKEQAKANSALVEVRVQRDKNRKIIDALYFYNGKFGIGTKAIDGNIKYGVIDKEGNEVIPYKYDELSQFDDIGFARAVKTHIQILNHLNKIVASSQTKDFTKSEKDLLNKPGYHIKYVKTHYLLDSLGNEYEVANKETELKKNIIALDLRNADISRINNIIWKHPQIKILLLHGNSLTSLPKGILKLKKLTHLDLSNNKLNCFPNEILNLTQLKCINLNGNPFEDIPNISQKLPNLDKLILSQLQLLKLDSLTRNEVTNSNTLHGSLDRILENAKKRHKPVFLYVQIEECDICKQMNKHIALLKDSVALKRFDVYTIDAFDFDNGGLAIAQALNINAFPTILLFDSNGILRRNIKGFYSSVSILRELNHFLTSYPSNEK
ncbi:MAG: WG repeat-containing protein [Bacteroidia bacterium]